MITQKQIAAELSVSQGLVADVLNGRRAPTTDLHRQILKLSRDMGYRPNHAARSLRTGRQMIWNILIPGFSSLADFNRSIIQGIADVAQETGYSLSISSLASDDTLADNFASQLAERRFDGVFIMHELRHAQLDFDAILQLVPMVVVNCPPMGRTCHCVYADGASGVYQATMHLARHGRRKIGYFYHADDSYLMDDRYQGFVAAHRKLDREPGPVFSHPLETGWGYEADGRTIQRMLKNRLHDFDALVCPADYLAVHAIGILSDLGVKVPSDVAVVGFDDLPLATAVRPRLTTVACDGVDMGRRAARLLASVAQNAATNGSYTGDLQQVKLETTLVIRDSCGGGAM